MGRVALKSDKIKGIWGFCWTIPVSGPFPRFSSRNPGTPGAQKPGQSYSRSHKISAARLPGFGCSDFGRPVRPSVNRFRPFSSPFPNFFFLLNCLIILKINYSWIMKNIFNLKSIVNNYQNFISYIITIFNY